MMAKKIRMVLIPIGWSSFGRAISLGVDAMSFDERDVMHASRQKCLGLSNDARMTKPAAEFSSYVLDFCAKPTSLAWQSVLVRLIIDPKHCTDIPQIAASFSII